MSCRACKTGYRRYVEAGQVDRDQRQQRRVSVIDCYATSTLPLLHLNWPSTPSLRNLNTIITPTPLCPHSTATLSQLHLDSIPTPPRLYPNSIPTPSQLYPNSISTLSQLNLDSIPTPPLLSPNSTTTLSHLHPFSISTPVLYTLLRPL